MFCIDLMALAKLAATASIRLSPRCPACPQRPPTSSGSQFPACGENNDTKKVSRICQGPFGHSWDLVHDWGRSFGLNVQQDVPLAASYKPTHAYIFQRLRSLLMSYASPWPCRTSSLLHILPLTTDALDRSFRTHSVGDRCVPLHLGIHFGRG